MSRNHCFYTCVPQNSRIAQAFTFRIISLILLMTYVGINAFHTVQHTTTFIGTIAFTSEYMSQLKNTPFYIYKEGGGGRESFMWVLATKIQ